MYYQYYCNLSRQNAWNKLYNNFETISLFHVSFVSHNDLLYTALSGLFLAIKKKKRLFQCLIHRSSTASYFLVESSRTFECYIGHETIQCMANALLRVQSPSPLTGDIPPIIYNKENAFTSVQNILQDSGSPL